MTKSEAVEVLTGYVDLGDRYQGARFEIVQVGGEAMKALRAVAGLSQVKYAEKLGVSQAFVHQVEAGDTSLPVEVARKMIEGGSTS